MCFVDHVLIQSVYSHSPVSIPSVFSLFVLFNMFSDYLACLSVRFVRPWSKTIQSYKICHSGLLVGQDVRESFLRMANVAIRGCYLMLRVRLPLAVVE